MPQRGRNVRRAAQPSYRSSYSLPRPQFRWRRYVSILIVVVVVGGLIYGLFFSGVFTINQIEITGNKTIPEADITDQLNKSLSSGLAGHNILFVNSSAIAKSLETANDHFSKVTVSRHFLHKLKVTVVERQPALLWQSANIIYVLSSDGRAVGQTSEQKPNGLILVHDNANLPVKLGDVIVPVQFISFANQAAGELKAKGFEVVEMSVPVTTNELYVRVKGDYTIKFNTDRPIGEQVSDLTAVIGSLKAQHKIPHDYIDLRVAGRAFYQ